MLIGFAVPVSGPWATPENQRRIAVRAEELGYHSVWTFQRLVCGAAGEPWPVPYRSVQDPTVTLAYLAGLTHRVRLGVAVLNMPFYSPALLAKQLATLDIVSGGRLDVGLGNGWSPEEFAAADAPFERRGARAEEFITALRTLWTDEVAEFSGEFYRFGPVRMDPKPVQRPHPPLLLGAGAPAALRRAGRLTDGWIGSSGTDLTRVAEYVATVRAAATQAGRDPDRLRFACRGSLRVRPAGVAQRRALTGSFAEIRSDVESLRSAGLTELFYDLNFDPEISAPDADPAASLRRAEEVIEALAP